MPAKAERFSPAIVSRLTRCVAVEESDNARSDSDFFTPRDPDTRKKPATSIVSDPEASIRVPFAPDRSRTRDVDEPVFTVSGAAAKLIRLSSEAGRFTARSRAVAETVTPGIPLNDTPAAVASRAVQVRERSLTSVAAAKAKVRPLRLKPMASGVPPLTPAKAARSVPPIASSSVVTSAPLDSFSVAVDLRSARFPENWTKLLRLIFR